MGKWIYVLDSSENYRDFECSKSESQQFYEICMAQVVENN